MAQQLCTPANVFGPMDHHLFLGCSVSQFSASAGWNEQQGELRVTIAQDTCTAPAGREKVYYDKTLTRQTTTAADPGFYIHGASANEAPEIGQPVYFRVGDFEYCGLLQSYEESNDTSGNPVFSVKIVDPREILAGTQIIIGDYAGTVGNIYNLINAFGFMEAFGSSAVSCPLTTVNGAVFGTPAGGFGGSRRNNNGMQWNRIKTAVSILTSSIPINGSLATASTFSPYGRLVFRGGFVNSEGYGALPFDDFNNTIPVNFANHTGYLAHYFVDLSEVPDAPSYFRFNGTSLSLLDMIGQVCQAAGCDYYIELVPVSIGGSIAKIIKIRTVSRVAQPSLNAISDFIDSAENVNNSKQGRELRNETTTSFIIGGNVQSIYQASQDEDPDDDPSEACLPGTHSMEDDIIQPYWGINASGNAIPTHLNDDGDIEFTVDTAGLALQLETLGGALPVSVKIEETELRMALAGIDPWKSWSAEKPTELGDALSFQGLYSLKHIIKILRNRNPKDLANRDVIKIGPGTFNIGDPDIEQDIKTVYEFVLSYARDFYGKKFMVRLPFSCVTTDDESTNLTLSDEPSDGGWTEESTILGLNNPSAAVDFFRLDDNRIQPFVRYDNITGGNTNLAHLNVDDYGLIGTGDDPIESSGLFVRANIEPGVVYLDAATLCSPRAIINLPQSITDREDREASLEQVVQGLVKLAETAKNANKGWFSQQASNNNNREALRMAMAEQIRIPNAASVPLKSNITTYGPFVTTNAAGTGPAGSIQTQRDDGLVPWEYGSVATMTLAGQALANEGITHMQVGEMGNLTVPGYPTVPLGAELGADSSNFFTGGTNLVENRSPNVTSFSEVNISTGQQAQVSFITATQGQWTGLYGPNITGLQVSIGPNGIQTQYSMRTFTPAPGKFSKGNADRLQRVAQNRIKEEKQLRANLDKQARLLQSIKATADHRPKLDEGKERTNKSPHDLWIGEINTWDNAASGDGEFRRTIVTSKEISQLASEPFRWGTGAVMSFDGLIRPVSMNAGSDGGSANLLPRFVTPSGTGSCPTNSHGTQPPIKDQSGTEYYNLNIDLYHLNPFNNPTGVGTAPPYNKWDKVNDYVDTNHGHDMEILGRDSVLPDSGVSMPVAGYNDTNKSDYNADYRFFALRGPLIMQAWGFDTNGKPVPNAADSEDAAASGIFTTDNLEDKFLDLFLRKSHTWPVAPIDLRLDRARGVWVSPPQYKFIRGELMENLTASGAAASAVVIDGGILYDDSGNPLDPSDLATRPNFSVKTFHDIYEPPNSGTKFSAYFDSETCEYYIIDKEPMATKYQGTVTEAFTTEENPTISGLTAMNGKAASFTSLSPVNPFSWSGDADAQAIAEWNHASSTWQLVQLECPASSTG